MRSMFPTQATGQHFNKNGHSFYTGSDNDIDRDIYLVKHDIDRVISWAKHYNVRDISLAES